MDNFLYNNYNNDWYDMNLQPDDARISLFGLDRDVYGKLENVSNFTSPTDAVERIGRLSRLILQRMISGKYGPREVEAVFRFACQILKFKGLSLEEYSKRDDIVRLLYMAMHNISSVMESDPDENRIDEIFLLISATLERENLVQKFFAGLMDFRYEYIFLAKLLRSDLLKKYFLDALRFYERVPEEELYEDRETNLDNVIEALANPGWTEFVSILKGYLYNDDDIIPFTSMDSLGAIGGEEAVGALKEYRRYLLEDFRPAEPFELDALDMNIIRAQEGAPGLMEEIKKPGVPLVKAQIGIRMLSLSSDPETIKFLYDLLEDERFEELDVQYIDESGSFNRKEIHFPLREESIMSLQNFDEDYVVSIVGEKYKRKRELFFRNLKDYLWKNYMDNYGDDMDFPDY